MVFIYTDKEQVLPITTPIFISTAMKLPMPIIIPPIFIIPLLKAFLIILFHPALQPNLDIFMV